MSARNDLRARLQRALSDIEVERLRPGLMADVAFNVGDTSVLLLVRPEGIQVEDGECPQGERTVTISAEEDAWRELLSTPPTPTFHSFTALQIANPRFEVSGNPVVVAQARAMLERVLELIVEASGREGPPVERDLAQICGQYRTIVAGERSYEVYYETAGRGVPVLFLHTAGADARQFMAQMSDVDLANGYHLHAFDLPFHGRSFPPQDWDGGPYRLTTALYQSWCLAFIEQVIGIPPIVVGGSMGAAMALVLAANVPQNVRGVVALEPPYRSRGRRNAFQNHVAVHGGLHNGAFVRGLMSPSSPLPDRRRASWIYSQGAPGIYPGDLAFYSDEFDGEIVAPRIDGKKTPVALLSGTYDYSATPADGRKLAAAIPGSHFVQMDGLGHFPMCENPNYFRPFLVEGLNFVVGSSAEFQS